jgi:2-polyprenyl-3-methyl-5-hydroxy-6-metoxy-1,4-benzoquinol methylase
MPLRPNAQYNVAAPMSLPVRLAAHARRGMYRRFLSSSAITPDETLLDVGVTSDRTYEASNYVEAWYPHKEKITAAGLHDASFLEATYPGLKYVAANGLDLPFAEGSFDVVHSSAVLEHVGCSNNQRRFIAELTRVARRVVFLTTPNRWFPVEFHTVLPLVHWLPKPTFRRVLKDTRYEFFSLEENLNLLGRKDLYSLCDELPDWEPRVEFQRLGGLPSNLLLTLRRKSAVSQDRASPDH